jgi:carbon monoxide dehydrogenase subunit G
MKISTQEDIEAPIEKVFAAITDFDGFERAALRRGIEVQRKGDQSGAGLSWAIRLVARGKPREILARVEKVDSPNSVTFGGESGGIVGAGSAELVALSRNRTRLKVGLDMRATILTSRIFLQSLKLAKSQFERRLSQRLGDFAGSLEKPKSRGKGA